jgi:hypothetical protein
VTGRNRKARVARTVDVICTDRGQHDALLLRVLTAQVADGAEVHLCLGPGRARPGRQRRGQPVSIQADTVNAHLAGRAQQLARGSDGLRRRAALCVYVACGTTGTLAAAETALEAIELSDVRAASLALLAELAENIGVV